jgi:hypothetical protein
VTIDESASASPMAIPKSNAGKRVRPVGSDPVKPTPSHRLAESGREHLDQGDGGPRIGG